MKATPVYSIRIVSDNFTPRAYPIMYWSLKRAIHQAQAIMVFDATAYKVEVYENVPDEETGSFRTTRIEYQTKREQ